jgi:Ca2+-binding RTX toxin-like protein
MANATSTQLQELYVAYFGRAADPTGLDYWTEKGITTTKFAADMYAQAEFKDAYGSKSVEAQVNQIYKNLFDREADVTGLTYWTQQINLGVLKVAEIATHLIWAAQNNSGSADDKTALTNRTNAAVAYTAEVKKTTAGILAYQAKATSPFEAGVNIAEAISYMSGIDKDTTYTAAGITSSVNTIVANGPAADYVETTTDAAKTLTLTAAIDSLTGGSGNDTFNAVNTATSTTTTNLDSLTGGAGTDILNVSDSANGVLTLPTSMTLSSIETLNITHLSNAATDLIVADVSGYADIDSVTITNAGTNINTITVTTNANVQSLTIDGGAGADIAAVIHDESTTTATATVANTDILATVSLEGLTSTGTLASDSLTSLTVKNVAGVVTNTDDYVATTDTRTLTVSHNGGTNGGVTDAGATTVNFNVDAATTAAGTNTFAVATTLNVDANGVLTAGTIIAASATDVNVNLDAVITAATITTNAATTLDYTGTANATITQTGAATAAITNSSTGNITLSTAIAAGQTYTGGSGNDTISVAATGTTANTTGAGDDTVTFAAVAGTGGSVDGGAGTDTVDLTSALAISLSAATAFEADFANFERVSIGALADQGNNGAAINTTIALANLDDINYVTLAGGAAQDQTQAANVSTATISGFQDGGTFKQTALLNTDTNVTITGAFTSASNTFNLIASGTNGYANVGALTLGSVETINITTDDTDTTAATTMVDFNMDVAAATTINVSGDIGITFANGTHASVTTMDASGVTATGAAGVVTFTGTSGSDIAITGGAGSDTLTGGAANDTIIGGAGTNALLGAGGNDTITGGAGIDTITGGTGADTLTGGAGNDIFIFSTTAATLAAGDTLALGDKIADYTAGDVIRLEAANTLAGASASSDANATTSVAIDGGGKATFAAADDTLAEKLVAITADNTDLANNEVAFFEHGSDTYIYCAGDDTTTAAEDFIIQLTGKTGFTTLTQDAASIDGDFTIA